MIATVVCFLLAWSSNLDQTAQTADPSLEAMFARASSMPRRVRSIEFQATITTEDSAPINDARNSTHVRPSTETTTTRMSYADQLGHFRCSVSIIGPSSPAGDHQPVMLSLYNGDRYQFFDEETRTLGLASSSQQPNPYLAHNPIVIPYLFLYKKLYDSGAPMTWSAVKEQSVWNGLVATSRFLKHKQSGNWTCDVIEVPGPIPDSFWHVYMAQELEYYPVRLEAYHNGRLKQQIEITKVKQEEVEGEPVWVPLIVELKETSESSKSFSRIELDPKTLKLNEAIDESLFTYPVSQTEYLNDIDTMTHLRVGGLDAKFVHDSRVSRSRVSRWKPWWFIVVNLSIITPAICYVIWVRSRSPSRS